MLGQDPANQATSPAYKVCFCSPGHREAASSEHHSAGAETAAVATRTRQPRSHAAKLQL